MNISTFTKLIAVGAVLSGSPAFAWEKIYNPYGYDTKCDAVNCYTPGTAYMKGHYRYLKCKDPKKYLTYRNGVLLCVPHKYIAK